MILEDFTYDGISLKDMGYVLCDFNSGDDLETTQLAPEVNFSTVTLQNGLYNAVTNATYTDTLTATLQICKSNCNSGIEEFEISTDELRTLSKWLIRKQYLTLKLDIKDSESLYTKAVFNISRMEIGGKVYGLELAVTTYAPYLFGAEKEYTFLATASTPFTVNIDSDEEGFIYPDVTITMSSGGTFKLTNAQDKITQIENCSNGEIISFNYPIISTNYNDHKIMDDFNWAFPRFSCSMLYPSNTFTSNLDCKIVFKFSPIIKIGI